MHLTLPHIQQYLFTYQITASQLCKVSNIHRVSEKKTSTHIIGYMLRNSRLILIIFDIKISHII